MEKEVLMSEDLQKIQKKVELDIDESKVKKRRAEKIPLSVLFSETSKTDKCLLIFGSLVAICTGLALPFLAVIMGSLTEAFVNATIVLEHPFSMVNTSEGWRFFEDVYSLNEFKYAAYLRVIQSFLIGVFMAVFGTAQVLCFLTASENLIS